MGLSTLQKCIVVVLMLTYGVVANALYEYNSMGKTQPWKVCWAPLFVETQSMHTPLLSFSLFFLPNDVLVNLVMVSETMFYTWHNVVMNVTKHTWQVWVWSWYACQQYQANKTISKSWHPFLMCSSMVGCNFWEQP